MGILIDTFSQTDSVSYGPFSVKKDVGSSWKTAEVTINGIPVKKLQPRQKALLALLVSQQGAPVRFNDLQAEFGNAGARNTPYSPMKVHIARIKAAIRTVEQGDAFAEMIKSLNPPRSGGYPIGGNPERSTGYQLIIPQA